MRGENKASACVRNSIQCITPLDNQHLLKIKILEKQEDLPVEGQTTICQQPGGRGESVPK